MTFKIVLVVGFASIGGLLFGLDQGNWGGAIMKEEFIEAFCLNTFNGTGDACHDANKLPPRYATFLSLGSSLVQFGAAFGALVIGPPCAGNCGRRETMFLGCIVTTVGNVGQAMTGDVYLFYIFRTIDGLGVGIVTYVLPMFISELAPPKTRGMLGSSMQLACCFGLVIAAGLNCVPGFGYRASFLLPVYPALIVALGIFFLPRSPRFALQKYQRLGNLDEGIKQAKASLLAIRSSAEEAEEELADLQEALAMTVNEVSWIELCTDPSTRRRVVIANMLQWLQQFTGINAILSYGPAIFESSGVPLSSLQCALLTNSFQLMFCMVMMAVIDRLGRRILLIVSAACQLVFMSAAAFLAYYIGTLNEDDSTRTTMGWTLLGCICMYMASFAIGWGGVVWVYPSEIFPMESKEKGLSTAVFSQWAANFLIAFIVPQQIRLMKVPGTFLFYSACLASTILYVCTSVPETKGVPLEKMGQLFGGETDTAPLVAAPGIAHVEMGQIAPGQRASGREVRPSSFGVFGRDPARDDPQVMRAVSAPNIGTLSARARVNAAQVRMCGPMSFALS